MLTIGQLAAYAGVTARAIRHYHQVGLLSEPERDASGYRRYGATAVVALIKIRTLAEAGVPLSRIAQMLEADEATFAEAVAAIDDQLQNEIQRLENSRKQVIQLASGDSLALPPEVAGYLDRLRALGVSERIVEGERDGWILLAAHHPDRVREYMPGKIEQLQDARVVRLYLLLSETFESPGDDSRLAEIADLMAELAEQAHANGEIDFGDLSDDDLSFDLLDSFAIEADPRSERLMELMRERGWSGWNRLERLPLSPRGGDDAVDHIS